MSLRSRSTISSIALFLCLFGSLTKSGAAPPPHQEEADYAQWVGQTAIKQKTEHRLGGSNATIKMVVIVVDRDDIPTHPGAGPFSAASWTQTILTADGRESSYECTRFDIKGTLGGLRFSAEALKKIDALLEQLPEDGGTLPPANRRLLVQAMQGDHPKNRVYDRANIPDKVWELLKVAGCAPISYVPEFETQKHIDARPYQWGGFTNISPDSKELLFSSMNGPLQRWELASQKPLPSIKEGGGFEMTFSPDGTVAFICDIIDARVFETKDWTQIHRLSERTAPRHFRRLFHPWFTPDGKYLAVRTDDPGLRFYDTRTCENVATPAGIPTELYAYEQSPDARYAVIERVDGSLSLWDLKTQKAVAKLDNGVHLVFAAFSPDGSMAATATANKQENAGYWDGFRIRVWKVANGDLVHKLRAYERSAGEHVEGLLWSPDSAYVLAMTTFDAADASRGISMWNVKSADIAVNSPARRTLPTAWSSRPTASSWRPVASMGKSDSGILKPPRERYANLKNHSLEAQPERDNWRAVE